MLIISKPTLSWKRCRTLCAALLHRAQLCPWTAAWPWRAQLALQVPVGAVHLIPGQRAPLWPQVRIVHDPCPLQMVLQITAL